MITRLVHMMARQHDPVRHPLGGWTCHCGYSAVDLEDMGVLDDGYVSPVRKIFSREHHSITKTSAWDETKRGF